MNFLKNALWHEKIYCRLLTQLHMLHKTSIFKNVLTYLYLVIFYQVK